MVLIFFVYLECCQYRQKRQNRCFLYTVLSSFENVHLVYFNGASSKTAFSFLILILKLILFDRLNSKKLFHTLKSNTKVVRDNTIKPEDLFPLWSLNILDFSL